MDFSNDCKPAYSFKRAGVDKLNSEQLKRAQDIDREEDIKRKEADTPDYNSIDKVYKDSVVRLNERYKAEGINVTVTLGLSDRIASCPPEVIKKKTPSPMG